MTPEQAALVRKAKASLAAAELLHRRAVVVESLALFAQELRPAPDPQPRP